MAAKTRLARLASLVIILATMLGGLSLSTIFAHKTLAASGPVISTDLTQQGTTINNKWSTMNAWNLNDRWTGVADTQPTNYFSANYPFIQRIQLMTATGGSSDRDLFVDPNNPSAGYDFSHLVHAAQNILNQGLKPYIVTGNVPLSMSTSPSIGGFGVNVRPPSDYGAYYTYIKACADALVSRFGLAQVSTWSWGVLTEYNNFDWFYDGNSAATTEQAYFKLYDYTVAALQASLGASNLTIGAHACTQCGSWNPLDFVDHVASGTNYYTGRTGTQINFLNDSYYDGSPSNAALGGLNDAVNSLRNRALADGLTQLTFGIDEGRLLNGPDGKGLASRAVGESFQGSYDALLFKKMVDNNISGYSRWSLNSNDVWGPAVNEVATNTALLTYKMVGDHSLAVTTTGSPANSSDIVDGTTSYNSSSNTVHVLAFNHNASDTATASETPSITINNIAPVSGSTVTVTQWTVDDTHAQWWPTWQSDAAARGIPDSHYPSWSKYSSDVQSALTDPSDLAYFQSRIPAYQSLATLTSTTVNMTPAGNSLTLTPTLAHHAVTFYEITNAQAPVATTVDNMSDWSKTYSHTANLTFDTSHASYLGYPSRAARTAVSNEAIVWQQVGMTSFKMVGIFAPEQVESDFLFYTSADGTNWTGVTPGKSTTRSGWDDTTYTLQGLSNVNYVKVQWNSPGTTSWDPQLAQVTITHPVTFVDSMNDWSKTYSHTANLTFDTSHASYLGYPSRAARTTVTNEAIVWQQPGMTSFTVVGIFAPEQTETDFQFYTSPDGTNWTGVTPGKTTGRFGWDDFTYTLNNLSNVNYLKVQWNSPGTTSWDPQLAQATITSTNN